MMGALVYGSKLHAPKRLIEGSEPVAAMLGKLAAYGVEHVPTRGNTVNATMPAATDSVLARLHGHAVLLCGTSK
ncbi:unnamed protein product, partial [Closterium sp. NIES-64]